MLPIDRVRELLNEPDLSDEEATIIRDECHRWVEFAIEAYLNQAGIQFPEQEVDESSRPS